jgi:PAS domain S-box-containing protein
MSPRRKNTVVQGRRTSHIPKSPRGKKSRNTSRRAAPPAGYYQPRNDLEELTKRYRDLFDFAPVAYVNFDRTGRIEEINLAGTRLLGRPRHALIGCPLTVFVLPEDTLLFLNHLLRCRNSVGAVETELRFQILRKKKIFSVRLISMPLHSSVRDGATIYQTAIVDFTERKRAEEALQESEARFREFAENSTDVFWILDGRTRRMQYLNPVYEKIFGESRRRLMRDLGRWAELIHPEDRGNGADMLERLLAGESMTVEYRIIRPNDGQIRWIRDSGFPIPGQDGVVTRVAGVLQDVTEEKLQRAQVEQQARLIDLSFEPIFVWDFEGGIVQWNLGAERLYGYTRAEALGRRPDQLLKTKRPMPLPEFREILEREGFWIGELRHRTKSGSEIIANSRHQLVEMDGRRLVCETIWNITEQKIAQQALEEALWQQQAIHEFVQKRNEANSLADIYESALDVITKTLGSDRASILLFDQKEVMRFVAWRGISRKYRQAVEGHTPWNAHEPKPQPIWISDVAKADLEKHLRKRIDAEGIRACASIPLRGSGGLLGQLMVYYDQPHRFTEVDRNLSGTIAGQLALAIERLRAQESLRLSEERFRLLVEGAKDYAIFLIDLENVITFWSNGATRLFGWTAGEVEGQSASLIFTPEDRAKGAVATEIEIALREGRAPDRRWHLRKDGSRFWADGVMMRIDDDTGGVRGLAKIARDATDQRENERALREARDQLEQRVIERTGELASANAKLKAEMTERSRLEQELLMISEREKRYIGQELHDSLCQELAASAFLLKSQAERIGTKQPKIAAALLEAAQVVNANVGLARDLARGLHPIELSSSGLVSALRDLAYRVSQAGTIECRLVASREVRIRDDGAVLNLYRIAQEAVNNAVKHARPRQINISLRRTGSDLVLRVSDDGEGLPRKRNGNGMGLRIMQHRANVIGGQFSIESHKDRGTTITCTLPGE